MMSDYTKLVWLLMNCATEAAPCKTCDMAENPSCTDDLMKQAADVIFELGVKVGDLTRQVKANSITVQLPKWISVKDKLPEPRVEVLVYIQPKNKEQPHPAFISLDFLEHGGYWAESTQPWEYEATHWMPLPEPPKEET